MTAATATLPRSAGNGAALVVVAANFVLDIVEKRMAAREVRTVANVIAVEKAETDSVWQLYRLTGGTDAVSPKAAAKLRAIAAG